MIRRAVLEWGKLPYGNEDFAIPQVEADKLMVVAAASSLADRDGHGVLEQRRDGLYAKSVVGVIASDGCMLEVLPKIEALDRDDVQSNMRVRRRLVHMLGEALNVSIDVGAMTEIDYQHDTLLELLIKLFVDKLTKLLRSGLPRRYDELEGDLPVLRGRINVTRQFSLLAVTPSKLACRFDVLTEDIILNQIFKAAVCKLLRITRSKRTQQRLQEIKALYCDVRDVLASELRWDVVILDRTNGHWQECLRLARLLLGNRFQATSLGSAQGYSLLFDMNVLFEQYIAQMLARVFTGTGRKVVIQGGNLYCLVSDENRRLFRTRPDILIKYENVVEQVIDIKWKRIVSRSADPRQDVAQSDVYQMMAYAQVYECSHLTLLYPHYSVLGSTPLLARHTVIVGVSPPCLDIATIDISQTKGVLDQLRTLFATA